MTKRRVDALFELPLNHPDHPWTTRGYRADVAHTKTSPTEDPLGEVAYQRAFLETAAKHPRRMPDPALYPNSPSAREFIARMDRVIFSVKKGGAAESQQPPAQESSTSPTSTSTHTPTGLQYSNMPSPNYGGDPPLSSRRANGDRSSVSAPTSTGITTPPVATERLRFSPRPIDSPGDKQRDQSPVAHGFPLVLEPKFQGPTGPSRMLR